MKRHRVTISALGTTGVLLAASLTMLALVSALVTFDAWPQRAGGESPSDVAVQGAPAARPVPAIPPSPAARPAARARAAPALAAATPPTAPRPAAPGAPVWRNPRAAPRPPPRG